MHDAVLRLASTADLARVTEILMPHVGTIAVAAVGALMLTIYLRMVLVRPISEGSAGLDRRSFTDPHPPDTFECRTTAKLLALHRR